MPVAPKEVLPLIKNVKVESVCEEIDEHLKDDKWLNSFNKSIDPTKVLWSFPFRTSQLTEQEREEVSRLYTEAGWEVEVLNDKYSKERFVIVLQTSVENHTSIGV